jgi:hypothetical protein
MNTKFTEYKASALNTKTLRGRTYMIKKTNKQVKETRNSLMNIKNFSQGRLIFYFFIIIFASSSNAECLDNNPVTPESVKSFKLYDDIGDRNKPNLKEYGFTLLKSVSTPRLWAKGATDISKPDLEAVKTFAEKIPSEISVVSLDIEHWSLFNQPTTDRQIEYLASIADTVREVRPTLDIGYFAILPVTNYNAPTSGKPERLSKWKTENTRLHSLANHVDTIYPALYTFFDHQVDWKNYAIANINEARKYGKPVIAYLWPQYHESNKELGDKHIDKEFWKMQLETVYEHADGVVIWTPWIDEQGDWNPDAEWWQATVEFINKHNLKQ